MTRSKSPMTLAVARMPKAGEALEFDAGEADRKRIAKDLGLIDLTAFSGTFDAQHWQKTGARVTGRITADAVQESVVTLEPVEKHYAIDFDMIFVPEGSRLARISSSDEHELFVDPEGEDPPETFAGDELDLLPYVEEQLALELDPYPREADASFEEVDTDPEPEAGKVSPFAGLEALKKQQATDK